MSIKAIQTQYDGYYFRSRLEARWAVFFNAAGIRYEYEPEGFELSDGTWYLPDFYLPDMNLWVEVKGDMTQEDWRKTELFVHDMGKKKRTQLLILGTIPNGTDDPMEWYYYTSQSKSTDFYWMGWSPEAQAEREKWAAEEEDEEPEVSAVPYCDFPYLFCVCPACGKIGCEFDGRGWRVCGHPVPDIDLNGETWKDDLGVVRKIKYPEFKGWRCDDKGYSSDHPTLMKAYAAARRARFEHGEHPRGRSR